METMPMTSQRPYFIRAIYEWIIDNDLTPYVLVDTEMEQVEVPQEHIQDGKIILNLSPSAIQGLDMGNEWISFSARFSGRSMHLLFPVAAVLAVYAQENGQGVTFPPEPVAEPAKAPEPVTPPKKGKPVLRRVK